MRRRRLAALLILPLLAAACVGSGENSGSSADYTVTIPAGASERPSAELLSGIPQEEGPDGLVLLFDAGETLRVVNEDSVEHTIGLVVVRPGETIDYFFSVPGRFVGACTLLAGESITVAVS